MDGSCNNLQHSEWGMPNNPYSRLLPQKYADKLGMPRRGVGKTPLPAARQIATTLFPVGHKENTLWPILAMLWGQFMAHDMSLSKAPETKLKCCTADNKYQKGYGRTCYPIKVPLDDLTMGKDGITCMNFTRTTTDRDVGCGSSKKAVQPLNIVTSWLDLSNVYGNTDDQASDLRTFSGGQMTTVTRNAKTYLPSEGDLVTNCPCTKVGEGVCYKTADIRSNQNPQLAILQSLFVFDHNRLARNLSALNPHWEDEQLYQEARRIAIAVYQHISYMEWLGILLGKDNIINKKIIFPDSTGFVNDYNSASSPAISNEHAHAACRFFHTHIMGQIKFMNSNREVQASNSLSDWYFKPHVLEHGTNWEQLTIGMVTQNMEETDNLYPEEVAEKFMSCGKKYGSDLRATDFQRDRDHGLAYYNDYRKFCGLKFATSWDDYKDHIPADKIEILKKLYKNFMDVDLSVGGSLENLVPGSQVGHTFLCILNDQFLRSRQSDRFWYENESSGFTAAQLAEIRKSTMAKFLCNNGYGVENIQDKAFILIFEGFNPIKSCHEIPDMSLEPWKEAPVEG